MSKRKDRLAAGPVRNNGAGNIQRLPEPNQRRSPEGKLLGPRLDKAQILAVKLSIKMEESLKYQKEALQLRQQVGQLQKDVSDLQVKVGVAEFQLGVQNAKTFRADEKLELGKSYHADEATGEWFEIIPDPVAAAKPSSTVQMPKPIEPISDDGDLADDDDQDAALPEAETAEANS